MRDGAGAAAGSVVGAAAEVTAGVAAGADRDDAASRGARTAAVIVASTSAAAGTAEDATGPVIRAWLMDRGFTVDAPIVVADGAPVGEALRGELALGRSVVLTTGGTGVSPDDQTPEQTAPLLDVELPGLIEAVREAGRRVTPHASLTRGVAGFAGSTFVMNFPGSRGGVRDGLAVLGDVLEHVLAQRTGAGSGADSAGAAGHGPRSSLPAVTPSGQR